MNVLIRADGTLDEKTIVLLEQMGEWLDQNGEAIYGSRPWHVFGEMFGKGKVNEFDMHANRSPFTSKDVRYTTNNDNLYAMVAHRETPHFQAYWRLVGELGDNIQRSAQLYTLLD